MAGKLLSDRVPQANRLERLRALQDGRETANARDALYYAHAPRILGLLDKDRVCYGCKADIERREVWYQHERRCRLRPRQPSPGFQAIYNERTRTYRLQFRFAKDLCDEERRLFASVCKDAENAGGRALEPPSQ